MKSTRKCPKCNWEYPLSYHKTKCRFCGTEFPDKFCNGCKQFLPISEFGRSRGYLQSECYTCSKARKLKHDKDNPEMKYDRDKRFVDKHKEAVEQLFTEWKAKTNLPFKPLTEQQWLEACNFFNGCALCGNEHIEIRQFFVNFRDGGRYTAWNIYPMCGVCATKVRKIANPFAWLNRYTGYAKDLGVTDKIADKLVKYLQLQIDKVE